MELTLREQDGQHFYEDGKGLSLPSVTTVLSILNDEDWNRMRGGVGNKTADAIMEEAGGIGGEIHSIIARLVAGDVIHEWHQLDARIRNGVSAYERWRKQVHYKPRRAETLVYEDALGYAGIEDGDGDIPAGHILLELKSGQPKVWHFLQLGAYNAAHRMTFKREKLDGACLLYLDKDTGYPHPHFISMIDLDSYFIAFASVLDAYRILNEIKEGGLEDTWKLN